MATDKNESGKSDINGIAAYAVNMANAPREFCILQSWKRWEPAGRDGDSVGLTQAELDSADFAMFAKYFSIRPIK